MESKTYCWLHKYIVLDSQGIHTILGVELPVSFTSTSKDGIPYDNLVYLYLGIGEDTGLELNDTNIDMYRNRVQRLLNATNNATFPRLEVNRFLLNERKSMNN